MTKKLAIIGSGRMAWIIGNHARSLGVKTHCFSNVEPAFIHEAVDVFHNISIFKKDEISFILLFMDGGCAATARAPSFFVIRVQTAGA